MPNTIRISTPESERPSEDLKNAKKHDPHAETIYGAEKTTDNSVEKTQKETRFPIYTMLGATTFSIAVAATAGYMLINGKYLEQRFNPQETDNKPQSSELAPTTPHSIFDTPTPSPNPSEEAKNLPKEVKNSEDLGKILKFHKIGISTPELEGKSNNLYMEAQRLRLTTNQDPNQENTFQYKWETMISHKGKTKHFTVFIGENDDDVIIATLNKQPKMGQITHQGVQPIATIVDEQDPLITYHYYRCVPQKSNNIASISLSNEPNKNIAIYSIQLKQCSAEKP